MELITTMRALEIIRDPKSVDDEEFKSLRLTISLDKARLNRLQEAHVALTGRTHP